MQMHSGTNLTVGKNLGAEDSHCWEIVYVGMPRKGKDSIMKVLCMGSQGNFTTEEHGGLLRVVQSEAGGKAGETRREQLLVSSMTRRAIRESCLLWLRLYHASEGL